MILDITDYVSEDALVMDPRERYDSCIIGATYDGDKVIYDANKGIQKLMDEDGMSEEEAVEYFEYNILGAYMGESTPIFAGVVLK